MAEQNFTEDQLREALKAKLKSGEISKEQAAAAVEAFKQSSTPKGNLASAIWQPTKAIAGSVGGTIGAGYAGLFKLATGQGLDAAVETVEGIQEDVSEAVAPTTQAGQKGLENVSDLVQLGIDVTQFPLSGLAGIAELVSGQGPEQAAKTVQDVQTKGVAQTAGDRAFEETGSPLFATAAYLSPELIATMVPVAGQAKKASTFQKQMAVRLKDADASPQAAKNIANLQSQVASGELVDDLLGQFDQVLQASPPRIQKQLMEVADDISAGVESKTIAQDLARISQDASKPAATTDIVKYIKSGSDKVKTDGLALDAIKQGFDEGVIASIKAATPTDRVKMAKMVDIMERGKADKLFAVSNRPSDIAGNSLLERVKYIKSVNREAGQELDTIAKGLKGQPVEFTSAVDNFVTRLDDIGIRLDENLKPVFKGSDIEGVTAAENVINKIVQRMSTGGTPDAHDLHRLKKFIDEQVTYGKAAEGLAGKTETVLKKLRHDIDGALDSQFPDYNRVNTAYADTVGALDSLQQVAGKRMDLFGPNADKAVGTLLRRLMGNAQSRINLADAVDDIEAITRKYGGDFEDSIPVQMLFADELDAVLGTVARTSFKGEIGQGVKQGLEMATGQKTGLGMLTDAVGAAADKARGITDENAIKSIKKILER